MVADVLTLFGVYICVGFVSNQYELNRYGIFAEIDVQVGPLFDMPTPNGSPVKLAFAVVSFHVPAATYVLGVVRFI